MPRMRTALASLTLAALLLWLAALSCYDIRQRRLPNRLTLPGAGAILLAAAVAGRGLPALAGAAALAAPLLTALCGAGMRAARCRDGVAAVPHGPSMCVATAGAITMAVL